MLVFSIAYIVRPFAGSILGAVGDLIGRRKLLLFTISLMGFCSLSMGLMPSYAQLGVYASISFVVLRIVQGIALSGELPGAFVLVYESINKKVGFATSTIWFLVIIAFVLANAAGFCLEYIFGEYAWRVGFIIGGLLGFIGYHIRKKLHETPAFQKLDKEKKYSFFSLFSNYRLSLISGISMTIAVSFGVVILILYIHDFVSNLLPNYNSGQVSLILIPSVIMLTALTLVYGYFSDKFGIAKMFMLGTILITICVPIMFYSMSILATPFSIIFLSILIMFCYALLTASSIFLLCDLFPTEVRLSGVGICYNLGFALVGGIAPLISTLIARLYSQCL